MQNWLVMIAPSSFVYFSKKEAVDCVRNWPNPKRSAALKNLVERARGIRALVQNAKQAAQEIIEQYGENAIARLDELEAQARSRKGIVEFFYWKLVREYIRDIRKDRESNS